MTISELGEYAALAALDPWGDDREDLRAGVVAAAAHSSFGAKCKPQDFDVSAMLARHIERASMTPEQRARAIADRIRADAARAANVKDSDVD
jgi:hypothetical protein